MLQLLSFIHFLDGKSIVFWNLLLFFGKYLLFLDFFEQFFIDFRLDFSRFWPFTATSHLTATTLKPHLFIGISSNVWQSGSKNLKMKKLVKVFVLWMESCNFAVKPRRDERLS